MSGPGIFRCVSCGTHPRPRYLVYTMLHLFAYGTLMCPDIMEEVAGARVCGTPGTLHGYRRCGVRGEVYPGLVPDEACRVEGVVYRDLTATAWRRLDRFEGTLYERVAVQVALGEGRRLEAGTYVVRPAARLHLTATDWDFHEFLRIGKARFEHGYDGYRALDQEDA